MPSINVVISPIIPLWMAAMKIFAIIFYMRTVNDISFYIGLKDFCTQNDKMYAYVCVRKKGVRQRRTVQKKNDSICTRLLMSINHGKCENN